MTTAKEEEEEDREATTGGDADLDDGNGNDKDNDKDDEDEDEDEDDDPYIELEQIDGKVATAFVHFSNQMCLLGLGDPTKKEKDEDAAATKTSRYERILRSFENQRRNNNNRIPLVTQFGTNPQTGEIELYNLWKKDHRSENVSFFIVVVVVSRCCENRHSFFFLLLLFCMYVVRAIQLIVRSDLFFLPVCFGWMDGWMAKKRKSPTSHLCFFDDMSVAVVQNMISSLTRSSLFFLIQL